ncbi:MAG: hypothetical protein UW73_C0027G0008 [Microgenomates group bacterium GW2011_GWB1_44_8]|nr:MAG: hypothetical protein UW73_C0027G0008 [Microgenomates group bacterium GW2011_GWB1_44_8]
MILTLLLTASLLAQTPSSTGSAIRDAVKEQVAAIKTAVAKRAFVGTISAKADATITVTNLKNESKTAVITGDTVIRLTGGKDGTFADLKVGDFVIAMGDVDSQGTLTTKRLLVIAKPTADKRRALTGRVTDTSSSSLTIETLKKEIITIKVTSDTTITNKNKLSETKVGSRIVAVGLPTLAESTFTAKLLHLIPSATPTTQ